MVMVHLVRQSTYRTNRLQMKDVKYIIIAILGFSMLISSCTSEKDFGEGTLENDEIKVEAYIAGATRTPKLTNSNLTQFGVYGFYGLTTRIKNVIFTKNGTSWQGSRVITWPSGAMNFYGISPSFSISTGNLNTSMTSSIQSIDYIVPTNTAKQFDILYSSAFNQTKSDNNGSIVFAYKPGMHYFNFLGQNTLESNYQVFVKTIIVHNLISNGKFTFSTTTANKGDWTAASGNDAVYANDTMELSTPIELTSTRISLSGDDYMVLIPQNVTKWNTDESAPIPLTVADTNHNYYVEIVGQIIKTDEEGNKTYLLGNADNSDPNIPQYESVYFPQNGRTCRIGAGSALPILFNGGYNKDGQLYIEHTDRGGGGVIVKVAEWQSSDIEIEEWTPYSENIEL